MYKLNVLATNKCNAYSLPAQKNSPGVCAFCFRQEEDSYGDIETVSKVAKKISVLPFEKIVTVTGGEPLLYPNIIPLVKELANFGKEVSLHTNGILLEEYIDSFEGCVKYVSLPFDGHKPHIADYYRGVGYYELQKKCMKILKDRQVKIGLHTLLTPYNFNEIESMAKYLLSSEYRDDIWYWFIKNFKRMNMSLNGQLDVYELDLQKYLDKVEDVRNICSEIDVYPTLKVKQRKPVFINTVGDVYIFNDTVKKNILAGNILTMAFEEIEACLVENGAEE